MMLDWLYSFVNWLTDWLGDTLEWILELLMWVPKWIFSSLMIALGNIIASIPVPDWVNEIALHTGGIAQEVVYFLSLAELNFGINVIISAMVLRWLLSMLPFVGR